MKIIMYVDSQLNFVYIDEDLVFVFQMLSSI